MNVRGNLVPDGWKGDWIGAISNHIGGNLICAGNTPAAQYGDAQFDVRPTYQTAVK